MPSCPIEMPSDTEMVPNSIGYPPASKTPSLAAFASRSSERLHGVISFHDEATPICGFAKSSSPIPTARNMPRAAARSRPSVTSRLRGFMSGPVGVAEGIDVKYALARIAAKIRKVYPSGVSGTVVA